MSEVIDIIHRLSYEVNDQALQRATSSISQQLRQIEQLQGEVQQLSQQYAATAATDVAARTRITRQIAQHQQQIRGLNQSLEENILHNRDLQRVLQQEQGIIGALNTRLEILRRRRDEATDVRSIRRFNQEIAATGRELAQLSDVGGTSRSGVVAGLGSLRSLAALGGVALGAEALTTFGRQVIDVTKKYQSFQAVLKNAFGEEGEAKRAFSLIERFAAKTPFQVDELTNSFIKLVNRGFKPTETQLRQLGDLAASQGKSFDQLTEAVLDAQTGEFERLKEFGIKAKQENDKVTLSFKDQTVTVKKNGDAIRDAVLAFGDLNGVAGSTAAISETLEGRMSNLSDTWDRFLKQIGELTLPAINIALGAMADMVEGLNDLATALSPDKQRELFGADIFNNEAVRLAEAQKKGAKALRGEVLLLSQDIQDNYKALQGLKKELSETPDNFFNKATRQGLEESIRNLEEFDKQARAAYLEFIQQQNKTTTKEAGPTAEERSKALKEADERLKQQEDYQKAIINLAADTRDKIALATISDEKALSTEQKIIATDRSNQTLAIEIDFLRKRTGLYKNNVQQLKIIEAEISDRQLRQEQNNKALRDYQKQTRDSRFAGLDFLRDEFGIAPGTIPDSGDEFVFNRKASKVDQEKIKEAQKRLASGIKDVIDLQAAADKLEQQRLQEKIQGYQAFENAAVTAYQSIAQAQQEQVNRDIETQQRRVDRVQAIADRGNAEALQQEEQRLSILTKEREKFARTQLAINAAQTLSSSILAVASAAGQSGAGAIVVVPAVLAALAAGFAFVKGMTSDAQGFRDGVVDLRGPGTPTSDSIPANLSRGESVVTAAGTAKHKEILEGMNAGRRFQMVDHNKILEMTPYSTMPTMVSLPAQGVPIVVTGGSMDTKNMEKRLTAIEHAVREIPGAQIIIDEHGLTSRIQQLTYRQNLLKKL